MRRILRGRGIGGGLERHRSLFHSRQRSVNWDNSVSVGSLGRHSRFSFKCKYFPDSSRVISTSYNQILGLLL